MACTHDCVNGLVPPPLIMGGLAHLRERRHGPDTLLRALSAWMRPLRGVQAPRVQSRWPVGFPSELEGCSQPAVGSTSLRHEGAEVPLQVDWVQPAEVSASKRATELVAGSSLLLSSPWWPRSLEAWVPEPHGLPAVLLPGVRLSICEVGT